MFCDLNCPVFTSAYAVSSPQCFSRIIKSTNIEDLMHYGSGSKKLILCDLDLSLIMPATQVGGYPLNAWIYRKTKEKLGTEHSDTIAKIEPLAQRLDKIGRHVLVDSRAPEILANLQSTGSVVLGCTNRPVSFANQTLDHLTDLGISLENHCSIPSCMIDREGGLPSSQLINGVIFAGYDDKGCVVENLLNQTSSLFQIFNEIVHLDDKESNLIGMEAACERMNISFTGILYERVADMDWTFLSNKIALDILTPIISSDSKLLADYGYLI